MVGDIDYSEDTYAEICEMYEEDSTSFVGFLITQENEEEISASIRFECSVEDEEDYIHFKPKLTANKIVNILPI
jgi:hypothetical protein